MVDSVIKKKEKNHRFITIIIIIIIIIIIFALYNNFCKRKFFFHPNSNRIHVLVSEKTEAHLPLCEINHTKNLHSVLRKFMVVSMSNIVHYTSSEYN